MEIDNKIKEFWTWFEMNKNLLNPKLISNIFIEEIDEKILGFGNLNWEIREGDKKKWMFIISPGGKLDLLPLTSHIISLAPVLDEWEFYQHKPPKKWEFKFSFNDNSTIRMIDVSDWQYVLYKFQDDTFDMIIKADNISSLPEKKKFTIADIVLENILGEEKSLKLIKNIEFVNEFSNADKTKKSSIQSFKHHIEQLENNS